jgi:uncharacterized protein YqjF (DUF2071 family)
MQKFLTADWRKLIMANYEVDEELLQPLLPACTETDTWEGKTYVSLVGFMLNNTKVRGIKIPFHINFPEVNLRFYVRYKEKSEWKRGVVFVREIVPRAAITFVANNLFREKYITLPMQYSISPTHVKYRWKYLNVWNSIEAKTNGDKCQLIAGSKEEFITEHFWGYSHMGAGVMGEYQVEHPRWDICPVESYIIQCDFEKLYGNTFGGLNGREPQSVFLAEGSPVAVYNKRIIKITSS